MQKTFTDPRDGNQYEIVKIGNQVMMAENLRFEIPASLTRYYHARCMAYDQKEKNKERYGYLYASPMLCQHTDPLRDDWIGIAPRGWHMPTKKEWETLHNFLAGDEKDPLERNKRVYEQLREGGSSGFNAFLAGFSLDTRGECLGVCTKFWSDTSVAANPFYKNVLHLGCDKPWAFVSEWKQTYHLSVRLFRD